MAYKFSRGGREFGDIAFEGDAGTGIDFEEDQVSLETGGTQRLLVNNYGATITGSLEITGSAQSLLVLHTRDADNLKEIAFFKDGSAAAAMQINSAEHFFIENENAKDLILRTRVGGSPVDAKKKKLLDEADCELIDAAGLLVRLRLAHFQDDLRTRIRRERKQSANQSKQTHARLRRRGPARSAATILSRNIIKDGV